MGSRLEDEIALRMKRDPRRVLPIAFCKVLELMAQDTAPLAIHGRLIDRRIVSLEELADAVHNDHSRRSTMVPCDELTSFAVRGGAWAIPMCFAVRTVKKKKDLPPPLQRGFTRIRLRCRS